MADYKLYIDLGDGNGYFEIDYEYSIIISDVLVEGEYFQRSEWNEITIENYPDLYAVSAANKHKLYNLILDTDQNIEIKIKYVDSARTIEGYFGHNDCTFNDDRKILTVTPTILDIYTDLFENIDKKVNVINGGDQNKVLNGDFQSWTDANHAANWETHENDYVFKQTINGSFVCKMPRYYDDSKYQRQYINVNAGSTLIFKFDYELLKVNALDVKQGIPVKISIGGYSMDKDGNWISGDVAFYPVTNYTPRELVVIQEVGLKSTPTFISKPIPVSGSLKLEFNWIGVEDESYEQDYTFIDNVTLYTSTAVRKSITVNLIDSNLKTYPINDNTNSLWKSGVKKSKLNDIGGIDGYFNEDGSPMLALLSSNSEYWLKDGYNLTINDKIEIYDTDPLSQYYKCDLSEISIYRGQWWSNNIFSSGFYRIYCTVSFSRDEYLSEEEPTGDWYDTGKTDSSGRNLWVRKPFNGATYGWIKEDIIENDYLTTEGYITWYDKVTSKKSYPVGDESKTYNTGIDLREIFKIVFNGTHPTYSSKNVYSTFLWNDEQAQFIIDSGLAALSLDSNYVTFQQNYLKHITCLHSFDLKTSTTDTESDSGLDISFSELIDDFRNYFRITKKGQLYWFLDENSNLWIEHVSYKDYIKTSYDIREYIEQYSSWDYEKGDLYSPIEISQENSGYKDFNKVTIEFPKITSNKRGKDNNLDLKNNVLSTDIRYAIENPNDLGNCLMLINHDGNNVVRYDNVPVLGINFCNGGIAVTTLIKRFGTYEGSWYEGIVEGVAMNFSNLPRTKLGNTIKVKGNWNADFLITNFGVGLVKKIINNYTNKTAEIDLLYRFNSTPDFDGYLLMIQNETDFEGATDIAFYF